jgi:hypothetical protein
VKCLKINDRVDVCVTVSVKLIHRCPQADDVRSELARLEAGRKAAYLGTRHEAPVAGAIRDAMLEEDLDF